LIEIVAAPNGDVERFRARLTPDPSFRRRPESRAAPDRRGDPGFRRDDNFPRPLLVALVGPTGAGKTTTAVKLALHGDAFGAQRVGFLTFDTYRAGAVAQLETYAGVAGIPLEVAYEARDVAPALARLS